MAERGFRDSCGQPVLVMPKALVPSVTVILRQRERLALPYALFMHQRADNGYWGFIGGAQEIGESLYDCVRRETREETGFEVIICGAVCVDSNPTVGNIVRYPDGYVQYTNITFVADVQGDVTQPVLSDESQAWQWWCSLYPLPEPFLPNHAWRVHQYISHYGTYIPLR